jgi:hypothetical protein
MLALTAAMFSVQADGEGGFVALVCMVDGCAWEGQLGVSDDRSPTLADLNAAALVHGRAHYVRSRVIDGESVVGDR